MAYSFLLAITSLIHCLYLLQYLRKITAVHFGNLICWIEQKLIYNTTCEIFLNYGHGKNVVTVSHTQCAIPLISNTSCLQFNVKKTSMWPVVRQNTMQHWWTVKGDSSLHYRNTRHLISVYHFWYNVPERSKDVYPGLYVHVHLVQRII